jgi:hypothetical protein
MKHGLIPDDNRIKIFLSIALVWLVAVTIFNIISVDERGLVSEVNNFTSTAFASTAAFFAWQVWRGLNERNSARQTWGLMVLGFALWAIAEALWMVLTYLYEEVPYPSVADLIWMPGYPLIMLAAVLRYRALKIQINPRILQLSALFFLAVAVVVGTVVIQPILSEFTESDIITALLSIGYPIGDLLILLSVGLLVLTFSGGRFSGPWGMIAAGLFALAFSDILFVHAEWFGYYYPDGKVTWGSVAVDTTYMLAYMLIAVGIYSTRIVTLKDGDTAPRSEEIANNVTGEELEKMLVFINAADKVVYAHNSLAKVTHQQGEINGQPFASVLGMDIPVWRTVSDALRQRGHKYQIYLVIPLENGASLKGWMYGLGNFNDLREYTGADLSLDFIHRNAPAFQAPNVRHGTLLLESEHVLPVLDYFMLKVDMLRQAITKYGGENIAHTFKETFNASAKRLNMCLELTDDGFNLPCQIFDVHPLAALLHDINDYAVNVISLESVDSIYNRLDHSLPEEMISHAERAGLREKT